jgi:hypothetical protein
MCQTFDHNYCVRVDSPNTVGSQVLEGGSPGRTLVWSGGTSDGSQGLLYVQASNLSLVLGRTDNSQNIILRHDNDYGTVWIRHNATGILYENRRHPGQYITGQNIIGSILFTCSRPCSAVSPYEQQWNGPR